MKKWWINQNHFINSSVVYKNKSKTWNHKIPNSTKKYKKWTKIPNN